MASRISFTGDFCCRRLFVLLGLGCCRGQVLGIEVCLDFLGQFQPGLVLRVGVGVHQDGCRCVAGVALHRLEVAIRLQQLVGGTGVAQTMEHDLLKLRVFRSPQAVPLCQQLRRNGQTVRETEQLPAVAVLLRGVQLVLFKLFKLCLQFFLDRDLSLLRLLSGLETFPSLAGFTQAPSLSERSTAA